jgi:hypothetical protein
VGFFQDQQPMALQGKRDYAATRMGKGVFLTAALVALALVFARLAQADDWWPHPPDATWTYLWTDSVYQTTPTKEKVSVLGEMGNAWVLGWTTRDQGNSRGTPLSFGEMAFADTTAGIINTSWTSNPAPPYFPILCPQIGGCNNSLASTLYYVIWGSRSPVLAAPVLRGTTWQGSGGAQNDVSSRSSYEGTVMVTVPAFPRGVLAAKVRTEVTQGGALGDPFGSGVRTVWWVFGIGPVKMTFEHAGGSDAPVTTSELQETNLTSKQPPPDANYFPLIKGKKMKYRWTNPRYLNKPSVQEVTTDEVVNSSARFTFKHISGPIRVAASYGFSTRTDGVVNIWGQARAATAVKFPPLGPKSLAAARRPHFFTPFDLMTFGFNPLLPAYPAVSQTWRSKNPSRDFSTFGVNGSTRILGIQKIKVPAGTFAALVVRSTLSQPGFKFGSGTRTSYFAPGKGLVKLTFRHGDGTVSTVDLLK